MPAFLGARHCWSCRSSPASAGECSRARSPLESYSSRLRAASSPPNFGAMTAPPTGSSLPQVHIFVLAGGERANMPGVQDRPWLPSSSSMLVPEAAAGRPSSPGRSPRSPLASVSSQQVAGSSGLASGAPTAGPKMLGEQEPSVTPHSKEALGMLTSRTCPSISRIARSRSTVDASSDRSSGQWGETGRPFSTHALLVTVTPARTHAMQLAIARTASLSPLGGLEPHTAVCELDQQHDPSLDTERAAPALTDSPPTVTGAIPLGQDNINSTRPSLCTRNTGGSHMGGFISGATDKLGLLASSSPHACGDESTSRAPPATTLACSALCAYTRARCTPEGFREASVAKKEPTQSLDSSSSFGSFLRGHLLAQWSPMTPHLPHL